MTFARVARQALTLAAVVGVFSPAAAREPVRAQKSPSLMGELGAPAAERLLASDASRERLRGMQRLSALGTPRAVELLARALDPGGAARGAEEHLAAVRALAPHAKAPDARDALVRALSSPPVDADDGALSEWVRSSAALALARTQDPAALSALGRALRKPGHAAELTKDALLASPPLDLAPILRAAGAPTKELCETLGALGDARAEAFLRDVVRKGAPEARAAAALSLLRLGSNEVVELARHWLRSERQPVLLAAAAEILTRRAAPDAARGLRELSAVDPGRAFELWLAGSGALELPPGVLELADEREPAALELLAREPSGRRHLERALAQPATAGLALYALSRAASTSARERLERALVEPGLKRGALRALALRFARLGDDSSALRSALSASLRAALPAERAAAAFAQAIVEPATLEQHLASKDPVVVRAVAPLATAGVAAEWAVKRMLGEADGVTRVALAIGLVDPAAADLVPTPALLELAHGAGPASLLAAAALAARKDADLLPLVRELLTSGDPWLRAHTLLGLSRSREPDALGLIENAYRFEPDPKVRHAAVVALSRRAEPVKVRALTLAATLDASRMVREAAALALIGQRLGDSESGAETLWLELPKTAGLGADAVPVAQVRFGAGLAVPLAADPDGVVAAAGVDSAAPDVRLALLGERVKLPGARP